MMTRVGNRPQEDRATAAPVGRSPIQRATAAFGIFFLAVGILGFIPGITTNYSTMTFAGHHSRAMLFGVFAVSVLHNLVHLAFGVVGLIAQRTAGGARSYLIAGGVIYLALWLYGVIVSQNSPANFVPLNTGDDWLHFLLGLSMIGLGVGLERRDAGLAGRR
jgi:hypothetical protein